jgi:DNA-directed RNA polymerase specialized sigma24 family protein
MSTDGPDSSNRPTWSTEQRVWLEQNIKTDPLRLFVVRELGDWQIAHEIVEKWLDYMVTLPMARLTELRNPQAVAFDAIRKRILNWKRDHRKFVALEAAGEQDYQAAQLRLETEGMALDLLRSLPREDAEILYLYKAHGYTMRQLTAELRMDPSLIESSLARSLAYLNPQGCPAPDRRSVMKRILELFNRKERNHGE